MMNILLVAQKFIEKKLGSKVLSTWVTETPNSLKKHQKIIILPNHNKLQIFEVGGNPEAESILLFLPGRRGPIAHNSRIVNSKSIRNKYSKVVSLFYPGQLESEGDRSMQTFADASQYLYDTYAKQGKVDVLCMSIGSVFGSKLKEVSGNLVFIHPIANSEILLANFMNSKNLPNWTNNYSNSILKYPALFTGILYNFGFKVILRIIWQKNSDFNFIQYGNLVSQANVYIPPFDEYASTEQLKTQFPDAKFSKGKNHVDISLENVVEILEKVNALN